MSGAAWTVPTGWKTAPVGRLVEIQSGFACSKKNLVPSSMGVAHLRPLSVGTDGKVDLSEVYDPMSRTRPVRETWSPTGGLSKATRDGTSTPLGRIGRLMT
jgi:hypothetical protein